MKTVVAKFIRNLGEADKTRKIHPHTVSIAIHSTVTCFKFLLDKDPRTPFAISLSRKNIQHDDLAFEILTNKQFVDVSQLMYLPFIHALKLDHK